MPPCDELPEEILLLLEEEELEAELLLVLLLLDELLPELEVVELLEVLAAWSVEELDLAADEAPVLPVLLLADPLAEAADESFSPPVPLPPLVVKVPVLELVVGVLAGLELVDPPAAVPFPETAPEVPPLTAGGVTIVVVLLERGAVCEGAEEEIPLFLW